MKKILIKITIFLCIMIVFCLTPMPMVHAQEQTAPSPRLWMAIDDRYLHNKKPVLFIENKIYAAVEGLLSSTAQSGTISGTVLYQNNEYAPVRAYYESLGMTVIWDGDVHLVRVYSQQPVFQPAEKNTKVTVLLYHHLLNDSENINYRDNGSVISTALFAEHMKYLHDNGFNTITLLQLYDFLYNHKQLPPKSVLITFDDGYYSNLVRAYPILKQYGQSAVLFTITGNMPESANTGFDANIMQYVAVGDLDACADVFEYATHTHKLHQYDNHSITLFSKADESTLLTDLSQSFAMVSNPLAIAYPLGLYSKNSILILKKTPIKLAFTTKRGIVNIKSDPYQINRNIIWNNTSLEKFKKIVN